MSSDLKVFRGVYEEEDSAEAITIRFAEYLDRATLMTALQAARRELGKEEFDEIQNLIAEMLIRAWRPAPGKQVAVGPFSVVWFNDGADHSHVVVYEGDEKRVVAVTMLPYVRGEGHRWDRDGCIAALFESAEKEGARFTDHRDALISAWDEIDAFNREFWAAV